jgi:hypothetical protein
MMTYAEVLFLQAEARARGMITTGPTAAALYQAGIRASMQQHGIGSAAIDAYIAQASTQYAGLRSIYLQKWIALYGNGPEQYSSWRRETVGGHHAPELLPAQKATTTQVPYRVFYPAIEQSTNTDNWAAAVASNGGATLWDKPVWWNTVMP